MAYKLSLSDFDEYDKSQAQKSTPSSSPAGGYTLTAKDIEDFNSQQPKQSAIDSMVGSAGNYLSNDFQGMINKLRGVGPWAANQVAGIPNALTKTIPHQLSVGGRSALEELGKISAGLPSQAVESLVRGGVAGMMPGSQSLADIIHQSAQRAKQSSITTPEERGSLAGGIGQFIGGSVPYAAIPGAEFAKAPELVERAVAGLSPKLKALGLLGGRAAKSAAIGAPLSAISNPDHMTSSGVIGGLIGGATGALLPALGAAPGVIARNFPKMLGGTHSPEEIQKIYEAAQNNNIKLPLGDLINSAPLKKIQNILAHVPVTGMAAPYVNASEGIKNAYRDRLEAMSGDTDLNQKLVQSLKDTSRGIENTKTKMYADRDQYADSIGMKFPTSNYKQELLKLKNSMDGDNKIPSKSVAGHDTILNKILEATTPIHSPHEVKTSIQLPPGASLGKSSDIVNRSATESQVDASTYEELAKDQQAKGNRMAAGKIRRLAKAIRSDMDNVFENSSDKTVEQLHNNANQYFKENVLPIRSKAIRKFTEKGADADTILPTFIKTGQYERPELLKNLMSHLNEQERNAVASKYLTKGLTNAQGGIDYSPAKIATAYSKIGPQSRDILFNSGAKQNIGDLSQLTKLMGSNADQFYSPKTGHQWAQAAGHMPLGAIGMGLLTMNPALIGKGLGILGVAGAGKSALMSNRLQRALAKSYSRVPRLTDRQRNLLSTLPFMSQTLGGDGSS